MGCGLKKNDNTWTLFDFEFFPQFFFFRFKKNKNFIFSSIMDISYLMMYRFHIELGLLIIFVPFHAKEMIYVTVALVFLFCFIFRLFLLFFFVLNLLSPIIFSLLMPMLLMFYIRIHAL